MVQIGSHKVAPEEFWDAAARALRTNSAIQLNTDATHLDITIVSASGQRYLVVEDRAAMQRSELRDVPVAILSDSVKGQLLSAAFSLYSRGESVERYREIACLLSEIIERWPEIALYAKKMVDRLADEIPNSDSRHLWKLQVELRRL